MSDPITIIGLAASVAQIVDVTGRLISKSCEIYQSAKGAFQENTDLELIITDLQMTNAKLAKIPLQFGNDDRLDRDHRAIRLLCVGCNEVADELLGRFSLLRMGKDDKEARKLESVKYAWKFMRSKRGLDALAARVAAFREQLQTRIIVSLTERFDGLQLEQSWRFDSLDRTGRDILDSIKQSRNLISADLGNQTDYLTRLAKAHYEEIINKLSIIAEVRSLSRSTSPIPDIDLARSGGLDEQAGIQKLTAHEIVEEGDYSSLQECLRLKPDAIFDVNSSGETPLHIAARKGDLKTMAYLLRKGAKKNADDCNDQTPLHLAVKSGNAATVRFLLSRGADPDTEDGNGNKPVHYVPQNSELSWTLSVGPGLEDRDEKGFTALREFVKLRDIDTVCSLLDSGATIDAREESTQGTPLLEAAYASDLEMMDLLIARGADVDARDSRAGTVLVVMAWHGLTASMRKLLDHGADIHAHNNAGFTALHETCFTGHVREEAAFMLMERGANMELKNGMGHTPLCLATKAGSEVIVHRMLELGANVNAHCDSGWTPLHEACEFGHTELVKCLLGYGAKTDVRSHQGYTPLARAAQQGNLDCVRAMLEAGHADVSSAGGDFTPLGAASLHGHYDVVKLLLERGASDEAPDVDGLLSIQHASAAGHHTIVPLLKVHLDQ